MTNTTKHGYKTSIVVLWCSLYHYCTTSFTKAWTKVPHRLKYCWRRLGDLRWWESLTMVPAGNKTTHLLSVNDTTQTIHHHHHHRHHHHMSGKNQMKPAITPLSAYINFGIEHNNRDLKFRVGDHVRISKYQNIFIYIWIKNRFG